MEQVQKKSPHLAAQVRQSPHPWSCVEFCSSAGGVAIAALRLLISERAVIAEA